MWSQQQLLLEEQLSSFYLFNYFFSNLYRIKKLIDMEALGLSRLAVIVLDMHTDVKGYSLFTLPQVRFGINFPQIPCYYQVYSLRFSLLKNFHFANLICYLFLCAFDRDEFWDLYKSHFHHRLLEGNFRIGLYGQVPANSKTKMRKTDS